MINDQHPIPRETRSKAGEAFLDAGLPRSAEKLLEAGIAGMPADRHLGDQQVLLARLAAAKVGTDDVEAGLHAAHRALDLAGQRPSRRAAGCIRELCEQLRSRVAFAPVAGFFDRARAAVPMAPLSEGGV